MYFRPRPFDTQYFAAITPLKCTVFLKLIISNLIRNSTNLILTINNYYLTLHLFRFLDPLNLAEYVEKEIMYETILTLYLRCVIIIRHKSELEEGAKDLA